MQAMSRSDWLAPVIAGVVVLGFTFLGGTQALGAHPSWTVTVGLIGAAIGAAAWLVLHLFAAPGRKVLMLGAVLLLACAALAWFGKTRFVASYAQDVLAGRFWFFGWMAVGSNVISLHGRARDPFSARHRGPRDTSIAQQYGNTWHAVAGPCMKRLGA